MASGDARLEVIKVAIEIWGLSYLRRYRRFAVQMQGQAGFTLIELLVVMAITATMMTLVVPQYFSQHAKAQETVLRYNLTILRQMIDKYRDDRGVNPGSLSDLVTYKYLRELPQDPITGKRDTWQLDTDEDGGIGDVHSGADGTARNGTDYASW